MQALSIVTLLLALPLTPQDPPPELERASKEAADERPSGLVVREPGAFAGYTLFAPLRDTATYLIDMEGRVVHQWASDGRPGNAVLLTERGHLVRCLREDSEVMGGGGQGGRIVELDWDGSVLWDWSLSDDRHMAHHDVARLAGGNLLVIAWEHHTREEALAVGRDSDQLTEAGFWPDVVLEVRPVYAEGERPHGAEVVWEWRAWDHLIQDRDPDKPGHGVLAENPGRIDINFDVALRNSMTKADLVELRELNEQMRKLGYIGGEDEDTAGTSTGNVSNHARTKTDWLHDNSVAYHPEHDLIVLSSPRLNEIFVIDHSTTTEEARGSTGGRWGQGGDLLYRWGNPRTFGRGTRDDQRLFFQHNPTWLSDAEDGSLRLLVFNNGLGRGGQYSTVEELTLPFDPEQGFVTPAVGPFDPEGPDWSFKLGGDYYAPFISGAQRLPNGNTLICAGVPGRLVEVTPDQRMVWDYMNPFGGEVPLPEQAQPGADMPPKAVFRATRIPEGDPRLAGRL
jgi:hypothetical protein